MIQSLLLLPSPMPPHSPGMGCWAALCPRLQVQVLAVSVVCGIIRVCGGGCVGAYATLR